MPRLRGASPSRAVSIAFALLFLATLAVPSFVAAAAPRTFPLTAAGDDAAAVAGASHHDGYRGAAYVYRRAGGRWVLDATLVPPERGAFARFGASVAMSGDRVVVGAPWDEGWRGAAYVYERNGGEWRLAGRIAPDGAVGDRFGAEVGIDGAAVTLTSQAGTIVRFVGDAGAWREAGRTAGAAPAPGTKWAASAELRDPVADLDARTGGPEFRATAVDPPAFVRASDGTYEDRTEIRWAAVDAGPLLFKIYRRIATEPPSSNVLIRVASQDDLLFSDATGTPGVEYTYCVSVVDMENVEGATRCDNGQRIIFPPSNLTASDATFENYVRLQWSDRSNVEAGYRILRDGNLLRETPPSIESVADSTAMPGTVYNYELIAFDAAGNQTTPIADDGESAFIGSPLQVAATDGQYTDRVVITWLDATALEVSYRVYRAAGGAPVLLATLPADSASYTDETAVNGIAYEYCVAAVDASDRESARGCDAGGIGILPGPANVRATDATFDDKVRVTWRDESETENGFLVYRMPVGTTDSTLVGNVGAQVESFDDNGGAPGALYTYCVVAFSNRGGRSVPVCDDGTRAMVLAPATVAATDGTFEDRVDLTWESTATAVVLFKIYRGSTFIRSVAGDRRSYSDDGGPSGAPILYSVTAVTSLGVESPATADSGSRRISPPVSLKASDVEFEDRVEISWTDRSAIETGFYVYRRLAGSTDPLTRIATRPSNSARHLDPTGVPGQQYEYVVTAFQAYGPGRADTTESETPSNDGSRSLLAPTFVEATDGAFEDQIVLTWVDESRYEEAYHVWRRDTATNDSLRVAVMPRNSNRFVDAPIAFGTVYEYSVFAVDSLGGAVLGTSPVAKDSGNTALLPPVSVSASDLYPDRVVVAWLDQSALETGYRVKRDGAVLQELGANATSYTDHTAVPGTEYSYCVESIAAALSSPPVCDAGRVPSFADGDAISFSYLLPSYFYGFGNPYDNDQFGASVDGEGQWLVVGAPRREVNFFPNVGTVTVLSRDGIVPGGPLGGGYRVAHDINPNHFSTYWFGSDVAMSGNWIVASGKEGPSINTATGDVVYFGLAGNTSYQQVLSVGETDLLSRAKVDIHGSHAVIGTPLGTSFWFENFIGPPNPPWSAGTVIPGATRSVALSGATALLGGTGSVRVATRDGAGTWSVVQTLTPLDPDPGFGFSVDLHGDRAVVGAHADSTDGEVYVYERDGGGTWSLVDVLQPNRFGPPSASQGGTHFGFSVALRGESILVGAPRDGAEPTGFSGGAVFLYTLEPGGWRRREVLGGPTGCPECVQAKGRRGHAVKITDSLLVAGDPTGRTDSGGYVEATPYPAPAQVLAPSALSATDGTYRDKVQITWNDNSDNEAGFKVYRDGALIATTDPNIRIYADFDAAPGQTHEYCVKSFLDSSLVSTTGCDFGRRPPDGNITGRLSTSSGAGAGGVTVCLDPSPNRALLFDGSGGTMTVPEVAPLGGALTLEFWYRGRSSAPAAILEYATTTSPDIFSVKNPGDLTLRVNGAPLSTGVDVNDGGWHHVAIDWTRATGVTNVHKDGVLAYSNTHATGAALAPGGQFIFGAQLAGALDDIRIWDHARTLAEIQRSQSEFLIGTESGLTAYWPLSDREGLGAEELKSNRYGRLSAGASWIGEAPPMSACAVSDLQGNYVLPDLRYGTSTTFRVTPTSSGHQYEPAFKTITLSTGSPVQNEVGFTDITSYTASGFVRYEGLSCAAANVPVFVDDQLAGTTDGSGRYAIPVSPGAHKIEARLAGHTFSPVAIAVNVQSDLTDQSFVETTKHVLSGAVTGGCGVPIGTLRIQIDSEDGCYSRQFDAAIGYAEALPPLKFFARVISVSGGADPVGVMQFFSDLGTREVDLTAADQTLDFKYRAPLRVSIEGLPPVEDGCAITVPVVEQGSRYPLTIRVFEDYGSGRTCPVDTGTVTVFDEILDQEKTPVTLVVKNGQAFVSTPGGLKRYETAGNAPNIFAGRVDVEGADRSYQKALSVVAEVEGLPAVTKTEWAIVTGHRPRAATFTALSEGIPLFVLRDPPGDQSYSTLARESSFCTSISNVTLGKFSTGFQNKTRLGIDILLGLFVLTKLKADAFVQGGIEFGLEARNANEISLCAKTVEEFKTSADKLFIGRDGDLYVGLALNLLFAKTDVIEVVGCAVVTSEDVTIGVDDIPTVYSFTDYHIRNVLIPQLDDLARLQPADSLRFNSARRNWEAHLALNDSLKAAAPVTQNRSFSAGTEYAFSATVDTTSARAWSVNVFSESQYGAGFDFSAAGSGAGFSYFTKFGISFEREQSATTSASRTTGYVLTDDDIGDFFSVNVKNDPFYGTPAFDIVGGTTSCPWEPWPDPVTGEPRTQPVDGPILSIQPPVRNNVPPDAPAVFTLNLTNATQADQLREYQLFAVQESNPGGAVLRLDGDPFANGISFYLEPGQTRQATLTVERGPNQYFYEDLKILMVPPCEYELFRAGGPLNLTHSVLFSVGFDAPCSDINLLRPSPGWAVPAGSDTLEILLNSFQLEVGEAQSLFSVGAEYQREGTDAWFPVGAEFKRSLMTIGPDGKPQGVSLKWPVTAVPEGAYTIRAFTRCGSESGPRNFSGSATGVIDRTVPVVFGTPEPADGVLSFGEDISITFNEDLDCALARTATVTLELLGGPNPVSLDAPFSCDGRTLVIAPTADLAAYEGRELRATVTGVRDRTGNLSATRTWSFTIRRGEFAWAKSDLTEDTGFGQGARIAVNLVNGLGERVVYTLDPLPTWLTQEVTDTDTIPARSQATVAFQLATDTPIGSYDATVTATATTIPPTVTRTASFDVHVNVLKVAPAWTVNPADYEHSMTVRAQVFVDADSLVDPDAMLAAFVGDQVRGVARPQLVADGWRYFLTVYGKPPAYERVRFRVWDARTSRTWVATDKSVRFVPDTTVGAFADPFELRTRQPSPANEQIIPVNAGWTWFSVNRRAGAQDDRTVAAVLGNLITTPGDLVKAQSGAIAMFDATAGWIGTLDTLGVTASYRLKSALPGQIVYESTRVLPSAYAIPVHQGWNWIGYTPDDARTPGSALAGLVSSQGDIVRSQSAFSEFGSSVWGGSLAQMEPGKGYALYRSAAAATDFVYANLGPEPVTAAAPVAHEGSPIGATASSPVGANALPGWEVDYGAYQYDMVVTAVLDGIALGPLNQVAAVVDGEIRGVARPLVVPALGRTLVFLMVRSNQTRGETVRFQALDRATGRVFDVAGSVTFEADAVLGTTASPLPLRSDGNVIAHFGLPDAFELGAVQPNPVGQGVAVVRYALPQESHVTLDLYDVNGRRVRTLVNERQAPGRYDLSVQPHGLPGGVYFYRMRAGSFTATRRMVVVR